MNNSDIYRNSKSNKSKDLEFPVIVDEPETEDNNCVYKIESTRRIKQNRTYDMSSAHKANKSGGLKGV